MLTREFLKMTTIYNEADAGNAASEFKDFSDDAGDLDGVIVNAAYLFKMPDSEGYVGDSVFVYDLT